MNTIQVALYARVSSEQQHEARTIDSQVADLRARIVTSEQKSWNGADEGNDMRPKWAGSACFPVLLTATGMSVPGMAQVWLVSRSCRKKRAWSARFLSGWDGSAVPLEKSSAALTQPVNRRALAKRCGIARRSGAS